MNEDIVLRFMMPYHIMSVPKPCDVGIKKLLLDHLKRLLLISAVRFDNLHLSDKLPVPKRKGVLNWLKAIRDEFPSYIVQDSFTGSGYFYEGNVHYSGDTESDSEAYY